MKIKEFLLPIWWYNSGLFPLGNNYFWVFVLNGLKSELSQPCIAHACTWLLALTWQRAHALVRGQWTHAKNKFNRFTFLHKRISYGSQLTLFQINYPCPPKIAWLDLFFCMLVDFLWHVHKQNSTGEVEFCFSFAYHHDFALEKQSPQYYLHRKLEKAHLESLILLMGDSYSFV